MTGFGKAEGQFNGLRISAEIRSLNSKTFDFKSRLPQEYQEKELEFKSRIQQSMSRGKVDLMLELERNDDQAAHKIQVNTLMQYIKQVDEIEELSGRKANQAIEYLLRMPEVLKAQTIEPDEEEVAAIYQVIDEAVKRINDFRSSEGQKLEADLKERLDNIEKGIKEVEALKDERIQKRKENLLQKLNEINVETDENRLEQELIYYIEKLDINEELVRLKSHCAYFRETMEQDRPQGRKLGFIGQELGREINTLGAKAYHAGIQKIVVGMKDELEKIKEQSLNIL